MKVTKATLSDLPAINRLNQKYFKEVRDFRAILENANDHFYVLTEGAKVIGFSGFHYFRWNNTAAIIDIFVHPTQRGQGGARQLIRRVVQEAKKTPARTLLAEAPSLNGVLSVYLKSGFRICGFNDRYYTNRGPEIAIFLALDLK